MPEIRCLPQVNRSQVHLQSSRILNAAKDGHTILVAYRGVPFAVLMPLEEYERLTGVVVRGIPWSPSLTPIPTEECDADEGKQ